jgi:hypothetical protein
MRLGRRWLTEAHKAHKVHKESKGMLDPKGHRAIQDRTVQKEPKERPGHKALMVLRVCRVRKAM